MIRCKKCNEIKPVSEFYKRKDSKTGFRYECKLCLKKTQRPNAKRYYKKNKTEVLKQRSNRYLRDREYELSRQRDYYKNHIEEKTEYRRKNKNKITKYNMKYYKENKHLINSYNKIYYESNKSQFLIYSSNRRAAKLQRTPSWLTEFDYDYIKSLYIQACELERIDGIKRHVDHIIPLQGKEVSGLHVPWNLQILTAEENLSKGNRYEVIT